MSTKTLYERLAQIRRDAPGIGVTVDVPEFTNLQYDPQVRDTHLQRESVLAALDAVLEHMENSPHGLTTGIAECINQLRKEVADGR